MDLVLKNCKLVDKNGEHFIKIEDGKITDISKNCQTPYQRQTPTMPSRKKSR